MPIGFTVTPDNHTRSLLEKLTKASEAQAASAARIAAALESLVELINNPLTEHTFTGGVFMRTVKADRADEPFSITPLRAVDSEGNVIHTKQFACEVASDNESVVSVTYDDATKEGTLHFGAPDGDDDIGLANVTATFTDEAGNVVQITGEAFRVTVGDPASFAGGTFNVPGIPPDAE
jgi:hypothetical protein